MELADRLVAAIEAGDVDAVRACFAPGAVVWHNDDGLEVDGERTCRVLAWLAANVADLRYDAITCTPTQNGYVQQHVLRGRAAGGPLELRACLVVTVEGGLIARIDEYYDSAAVGVLLSPR